MALERTREATSRVRRKGGEEKAAGGDDGAAIEAAPDAFGTPVVIGSPRSAMSQRLNRDVASREFYPAPPSTAHFCVIRPLPFAGIDRLRLNGLPRVRSLSLSQAQHAGARVAARLASDRLPAKKLAGAGL
ncbi:MAG: hypothetical protein ACK4NP_07810 [Parvularculaceae bacterium]